MIRNRARGISFETFLKAIKSFAKKCNKTVSKHLMPVNLCVSMQHGFGIKFQLKSMRRIARFTSRDKKSNGFECHVKKTTTRDKHFQKHFQKHFDFLYTQL